MWPYLFHGKLALRNRMQAIRRICEKESYNDPEPCLFLILSDSAD